MVVALTSFLILLSGASIAVAGAQHGPAETARCELLGGGLLATGLLLIGIGLRSSFGSMVGGF